MPFKYRLTYRDGDGGRDLLTAVPDWNIGDTFRTGDGHRLRMVNIVPELELGVYAPLWMVEHFELV